MAVEHDVLWLQISVNYALLMEMTQSHGDFCQVEAAKEETFDMLTLICHLFVDAVLADPLSFCPCSNAAELYLSLYSSNTDGG